MNSFCSEDHHYITDSNLRFPYLQSRGPFHETPYNKNRCKSKGKTIHKMFNSLFKSTLNWLTYAESCIFSKYSINRNVFDLLNMLQQICAIDKK